MANLMPYGNVPYADPGYQPDKVHRYPLDTEAHVRAAWSYIHQADNRRLYTAAQLADIEGRIMAAGKKYGIQFSEDGTSGGGSSSGGRAAGDQFERRFTENVLELRAAGRGIGGYAAMFDRPSNDMGGWDEVVRPTAFNDSRGRGWPGVVARYNHDDLMLLGTTRAGTLRLNVDNVGLNYDVTPPAARADILQLVERGDIGQSSFAFRAMQDEWSHEGGSFPRRSLLNLRLFDVAPVVMPAYPDTTALVRSMRTALASLAATVEADLDEVVRLATDKELRKLFIRTDLPGHPKSRTFGSLLAAHEATQRNPWASRAR